MKVLQVVSFFSPQRGGGVIAVTYDIARALVKRGHEVTIYTGDFDLDRDYMASLKGVEIHAFPTYLKLQGRPLFSPGVIFRARRELATFDVIHTHEMRSFLNLVLWYFAKKYRVPFIVDSHGAVSGNSRSKLKWWLDIIYGRRILKNATRVIAETETGDEEYRRAGVSGDRIVRLYPPFPTEDYDSLPAKGGFRRKFGIGERPLVLFLGRIARIKGVDFLVEAFAELAKERDDVVLAIAGSDDGFRAEVELKIAELGIAERVLFTGYVAGEDKKMALLDADMMVQPSVYGQGIPRAGIEAVLCGTPVVVTKNTGAAEDMERMGGSYMVDYGNAPEFADVMNSILNRPDEAAEEVRKLRNYIEANLSMTHKIGEYEKIYRDCIAKP